MPFVATSLRLRINIKCLMKKHVNAWRISLVVAMVKAAANVIKTSPLLLLLDRLGRSSRYLLEACKSRKTSTIMFRDHATIYATTNYYCLHLDYYRLCMPLCQ
ncbi:uncharacterized protein LOC123427835 [Hordeum vulgare subsp. vulgare]|uniref:uncharacterized protein LOC123427835 n=1 Tax=Hordeum vulgare subsp. vulgare TaxID=112509 RepID=UPI001D1A47E5|nr:uncharacterized protein LOC123427835 [Hordeum vulgare subsp. vulgare]